MHRFTGLNSGGTLIVERGVNSIILTIYDVYGTRAEFYMKPDDFGDVAAALWECSPTKQPITITGTQTEEGTAKENSSGTQMGIFESKEQDSSSDSTGYSLAEAEGQEPKSAEDANLREGTGQATDAGTSSGSEAGS